MTKVYIVMGASGSYEDLYKWNEYAHFEKFIAQQRCDELNEGLKANREWFHSTGDHVTACQDDNCELCDSYYDRQSEIEEQHDYWITELDVGGVCK